MIHLQLKSVKPSYGLTWMCGTRAASSPRYPVLAPSPGERGGCWLWATKPWGGCGVSQSLCSSVSWHWAFPSAGTTSTSHVITDNAFLNAVDCAK